MLCKVKELVIFGYWGYLLCSNFCFCFFSWNFYRHCEFHSRIKNLRNSGEIYKCKLLRKKNDNIEVLCSRLLMNLSISHDERIQVNNVIREYDDEKCSKNTKSINPKTVKRNKWRRTTSSKCTACNRKIVKNWYLSKSKKLVDYKVV